MKQDREDLLQKLEAVAPGLAMREAIEQSSCFVFQGGRVCTFNDEVACSIECDIGVEGAVAAKPLLELLRKLAEKEVDITMVDDGLRIKGKGRRSLVNMEAEIMLPLDAVDVPETWEELNPEFADAIGMVQECATKDNAQFILMCIHITPDFVEACNNYKMARYTMDTGIGDPCLVKRDCIKHIVGLGMTKVSRTDTWLHFCNPAGLVFSVRRDEANYADMGGILAKEGTPTTLPGGLADAVEKAEIFSADNSEGNSIMLTLDKGHMTLKGSGAYGWYEERKEAKWDAEPLSFEIDPVLLKAIAEKANDCYVADGMLKIDTGKLVYITCTKRPKQ